MSNLKPVCFFKLAQDGRSQLTRMH